ncbi:MAG: hypothetical protein IT310_01135 [Anaerolineales bacterium]|nr:hypothetical protein [Anaerolineales bacterium]
MKRAPTFNQIQPDQAIAICSREQALRLAEYDQHGVTVLGRRGVLLTGAWALDAENSGPFILTVVFRQADQSPLAPEAIQTLVDQLNFQVRGQAR